MLAPVDVQACPEEASLDFINYLNLMTNEYGIPLNYVIRKEDDYLDVNLNDLDEREKLVAKAPLQGRTFKVDNATVYKHIVSWTSGHDAYTFVQQHEATRDGRQAFLDLQEHYFGSHE